MKALVTLLNEALSLYEEEKWTYLVCATKTEINFFSAGNYFSPSEVEKINLSEIFIARTDKSVWEESGRKVLEKAYTKKYNKNLKNFDIVLCSYGSKKGADYIKKIYKLINENKIKIESIFESINNICKKYNIKHEENIAKYLDEIYSELK